MSEETNVPDNSELPGDDLPGDDFESRTSALTAQLDRLEAETNEFITKRQREEHAANIRKPLHSMLAKIGFEPAEFRECERAVGGLQNFHIGENGELMTELGGMTVRARDVIQDHPGLLGLLRNVDKSRSDQSQLEREKAQLEKRRNELVKYGCQNRGNLGPRQSHELQQIVNRLHEIEAIENRPVEKPAGIVDRNLLLKRNALIEEREHVQREFRRSGGRRDDLLIRADKLTREITAISAKIAAQQAG
jgi:hypothetical protein